MKWMDRPSVAEIERGGVYEMEIEISSINFCDTWSFHPSYINQTLQKLNFESKYGYSHFKSALGINFFTSGIGQNENYANTRICIFSV